MSLLNLLRHLFAEFGTSIMLVCFSNAKGCIILIDNISVGDSNHSFYPPPPDTLEVNVDATLPPQSAHDAEDVPPPIPPKQFSDDDDLLLCKLSENRELQGNVPLTCSPNTNQKDTTISSLPPNMNQQTTVSDQSLIPQ